MDALKTRDAQAGSCVAKWNISENAEEFLLEYVAVVRVTVEAAEPLPHAPDCI